MKKTFLCFLILIVFLIFISPAVYARDSKNSQNNKNPDSSSYTYKIKTISSPNWVHPNLRKNYKGYPKQRIQKQFSPMWQHSTNRQSGNIMGGGTTKYKDYAPFYHPSQK